VAEITPRRQGELVRGVFKILKDAPEGLQAAEVLRQLELAVPPTPFESTHQSVRLGSWRRGGASVKLKLAYGMNEFERW
jgi:restriction system protein